jgi:hypothetical protein
MSPLRVTESKKDEGVQESKKEECGHVVTSDPPSREATAQQASDKQPRKLYCNFILNVIPYGSNV